MSRTDNHRPFRVKQRDPTLRHLFTPYHEHWVREDWDKEAKRYLMQRSVPCDLDAIVTGKTWKPTNCRLWPVHRMCTCRTEGCSGQRRRRQSRRQERHQWRGTSRAILAQLDRSEVDVPPIRGKAW